MADLGGDVLSVVIVDYCSLNKEYCQDFEEWKGIKNLPWRWEVHSERVTWNGEWTLNVSTETRDIQSVSCDTNAKLKYFAMKA